jgi:hypothetical protein
MCFWIGGVFQYAKTKEAFCKHKYEKHAEVEECQSKPFPWESK